MWFWCLDHSQTEENAGCGSEKRLGPYPTAQAAATALKRINAREADESGVTESGARKAPRSSPSRGT